MSEKILEVRQLATSFHTERGWQQAIDGVSFDVYQGEILGIVGESGCGKSVTMMSLIKLLPPAAQVTNGSVVLDGVELTTLSKRDLNAVRGSKVGMIFQDPMTSLNPFLKIGLQLAEGLVYHKGMSMDDALKRSAAYLDMVGISNSTHRLNEYPHQLSGGMRQRVMIAMALLSEPELVIADEPTTALDVTIQAQILDLLRNLKNKINSSIMLITHDLGVIAEMADYVVVMYAGRVVEKGTVQEIFANPSHPYTIGLMASKPVIGKKVDKLYSIPGKVPNPVNMPDYCYFRDRCEMRCPECDGKYPCEISLSETHKVSCYRYYDKKEGK